MVGKHENCRDLVFTKYLTKQRTQVRETCLCKQGTNSITPEPQKFTNTLLTNKAMRKIQTCPFNFPQYYVVKH